MRVKPAALLLPILGVLAACSSPNGADAGADPAAEAIAGPVIYPELGESADHLAKGRTVYEEWCATCHAPNGRMAGTIALEAKYEGAIPPAIAHRTDLSADTIAMFVRQGVSVMAPFRKTEITDQQLTALSAFLTAPLQQRGVDEVALDAAMSQALARQETSP